ncbi:hypothetical protein EHQ16_12355 [Leptospira kanakyensis]|uniref:Uncharacterized protein n=1 Tax=Leptospira kanakyensis TaxID=2484968 RepID=A0A6N4Q7J7_9LEPT|nr:hypothetical protein [Leptospira kanakyensis]TGK54399.1 hypothetical protein EHQ11_02260 [Leptospira kanakyensis]TGK59133.1 hypothetical protein EHQ16_12355 [Leptospira kanakyensis]TGK75283.1 hypothetical protein EHQ18_03030 [Leptospira kanakyensis]
MATKHKFGSWLLIAIGQLLFPLGHPNHGMMAPGQARSGRLLGAPVFRQILEGGLNASEKVLFASDARVSFGQSCQFVWDARIWAFMALECYRPLFEGFRGDFVEFLKNCLKWKSGPVGSTGREILTFTDRRAEKQGKK